MILITGGLGFIGLHTAKRFLDAGEKVVLTHYRVRREPDFIKAEIGKSVFIEPLDVTSAHDAIDLARKHKVTGIVHLAVPGLNALSAADDYRVNVTGWLNILEAGRLCDARRISLASSIAVYAGLPAGPFREDMLLPVNSGNATETFKKALEILGMLCVPHGHGGGVVAHRQPFRTALSFAGRSFEPHMPCRGERSAG